MRRGAAIVAGVLAGVAGGCTKVPLSDVAAAFTLNDITWFAEEETLFVFYRIEAEQGLGAPNVIELTYATDAERVDWTALSAFDPIHTHLDVDCGPTELCGSWSLHVPLEPREVDLRLRYHVDGELSLNADTVYNVVGEGAAHTHRSLLVYGVFDETNQRAQWRSRHQFPTLRNQDATDLGLRREFHVEDQRYGTGETSTTFDNPYAYGEVCDEAFTDAGLAAVRTTDRAAFNSADLPLEANEHALVCGPSTVTDATGTFTTDAFARKNPETRAAFPLMRTPVHAATPLKFFLEPCDRELDPDHYEMQRQRLLAEDVPAYCTDNWSDPGWLEDLVDALTDAIEAARPAGNDMVLVLGLHREHDGLAETVQEALALVAPEERHRSTPRVVGAFVLDTDIQGIQVPELEPVTLWCPATSTGSGASTRTCAIAPDNPDIELGPLSFATLPVFPSEAVYLDFIDTYSKRQAGEVEVLEFLAPEFPPSSSHIDLGEYGTITFLDGELISAEPEHAFSHCVQEEPPPVVFRSRLLQSETFQDMLVAWCNQGIFDEDFCSLASIGVLTVDELPGWHLRFSEDTYELGLFWDFPFLLRVEYEAYFAGSLGTTNLSVPFGVASDGEAYYGTWTWLAEEFALEDELLQCTRFCTHPTFDSSTVYNITSPFHSTYANSCYAPAYPRLGDGGFPLDP